MTAPEPFIKICGLQTYEEAVMALDCGATALGFLVGLTHFSEDKITETDARNIIKHLPEDAYTVLVTHLLDPGQIGTLAAFMTTKAIQVHGDVPTADMCRIRSAAAGRYLIKAVHVTGTDAIADARTYAQFADALLLDSRTHDRLGGTGLTHDWSISRRIIAAVAPMPVYLAGGLDPDNVTEAIRQVTPAGIDVNSGVEDRAGRKDRTKLLAFITNARKAFA